MGLDATLKRFLPAIIAVMIAIIAYFQAVGMGQLLAATVAGADVPQRAASHRRPAAIETDRDHQTSALAILERNPFDSVTGPLHEKEAKPAETGEATALGHDPYADPPCAGARAVLIASAKDPAWSFAIIVGADGKSVLRRKDEEIDGQKVYFVGDLRPEEHEHLDEAGLWDRVWLTSGSGRCQLALGAKPVGMKGQPPPQPQPQPQAGATSPLAGKIRQISDHEFEVDRSAVEATIANPAELMKARIFPVRDGDKVMGMKLMGIRQGTALGLLGLQNGDVLTGINGFEMNDPQRMLEAYSKLMSASNVTATVIRNGKPMNIDFHVK
jgi:general secretion pathway protein C